MCRMWKRAGLSLLLAIGVAATAMAQSETQVYYGTVGFVDESSVEVGGERGILANGSSVMSDGHAVSLASVRIGMPATLEVDESGRIIELRVTGVVE
jgi:hypothetical protein